MDMTEQQEMAHDLKLEGREKLTLNGITEVISFDDTAVVLKTALGTLVVQGSQLQLKNLSPEGGQVVVDGSVTSLVYEQLRSDRGFWQRLFG